MKLVVVESPPAGMLAERRKRFGRARKVSPRRNAVRLH